MRLYDGWGASDFDVKAEVNDELDKRERKDFDFKAKKGKYDVVGLNVTKVSSQMIPAIERWVGEMETKLNGIQATQKQESAFKSDEVQQAVTDFINNVRDYCINLTSDLLAFADKLKSVENAYKANMAALGQAVDTVGKGNAAGEHYTRKVQ